MSDFPEFDNMPDDPEVAFVRLYELFATELQAKLAQDKDNRFPYAEFMNDIIGMAKGLQLGEFDAWHVPDEWDDIYPAYVKFDGALKRYVMEIKVRKSHIGKTYSVELDGATKKRIHFLIGKIRDVVEAADIEERKKNSLFKKLAAFAADVDKARTTFNNAMLMGFDVANLAKQFGEAFKPATDFVKSITELLAEAKANEPEKPQLPPAEERKKLEPPPKRIEGPKFSLDMDDDIPF